MPQVSTAAYLWVAHAHALPEELCTEDGMTATTSPRIINHILHMYIIVLPFCLFAYANGPYCSTLVLVLQFFVPCLYRLEQIQLDASP